MNPMDILTMFPVRKTKSQKQVFRDAVCDYAEKLYNFFASKCDKEILREKILCDLLSSSSSVQIPEIFKRKDVLYKQIKKHFIENVDKNIKIAILYSANQVFAVNQTQEKNLHNRYEGKFYDIKDLNL